MKTVYCVMKVCDGFDSLVVVYASCQLARNYIDQCGMNDCSYYVAEFTVEEIV